MKDIRSKLVLVLALMSGLLVASGCDRNPGEARVRVAAILPLTGPAASIGQDEKLGIELAYADNASASRLLEFVFEDSQSKPDVTVTALRKQLDVDGTSLFIVSTTAPVQAALPALRDSKKDVFAVVAATMPDITAGYPFAYRIYPTATEEVSTIAGYAKAMGYRKLAGYAPKNRVGEESLKMLAAHLQADGGSLLLAETFETTEKDFRSVIAKFKAEKVDAIVLTGAFPAHYVPILRQMAEAGIDVPVLGGVALATAGVEKELPPNFLARIKFVAPPFYFNSETSPKTTQFVQAVKARGKTPNYEIGYAYDSAAMLLLAVEASVAKTPQGIATAFAALSPFQGVAGPITFNETRDAVLGFRMSQWGPNGIVLAK